MLKEVWIKRLKSNDRTLQLNATMLHPLDKDDDAVYSILPLMVEKAREVDVNNGATDIHSSTFVGRAATNAARGIRKRGYSNRDEFHRLVVDWILELNHCSDLNVAGYSVRALGCLWVPPDSIRERLLELVHANRRPDNPKDNLGSIRGLAYRMLSQRDRAAAKQLIDTPARVDFQNQINAELEMYRVKYPNNENVPRDLEAEIGWLSDAGAG